MTSPVTAALIGLAGCSSSPAAAPAPKTAPQGVLMSWETQPLPGSGKEFIDGFAKTFQAIPADVVIESKSDSRLVMTMDMAKAGEAMAPRAKEADYKPTPVRIICEVAMENGTQVLKRRQYYLGNDPKVLAEIKEQIDHITRTTGEQPPSP